MYDFEDFLLDIAPFVIILMLIGTIFLATSITANKATEMANEKISELFETEKNNETEETEYIILEPGESVRLGDRTVKNTSYSDMRITVEDGSYQMQAEKNSADEEANATEEIEDSTKLDIKEIAFANLPKQETTNNAEEITPDSWQGNDFQSVTDVVAEKSTNNEAKTSDKNISKATLKDFTKVCGYVLLFGVLIAGFSFGLYKLWPFIKAFLFVALAACFKNHVLSDDESANDFIKKLMDKL